MRDPYGDCPACGHDWREHIPPEPCGECRYEIDHGEPGAPAVACAAAPPVHLPSTDPAQNRRLSRWLLLLGPAIVFVFDLVLLLVTYLLVARIAPGVLGETAMSPAVLAVLVVAVKTPMTVAYQFLTSYRLWTAAVVRGEFPEAPVPKGRRRMLVAVRDWAAEVVGWVAAVLIVVEFVAGAGDAPVGPLAAVTAAGPLLLPWLPRGLFRLARWGWRRRPGHRARHAVSE